MRPDFRASPSSVQPSHPLVGHLTHWQEDRGFGFIQAVPGGEHVYVHRKAFTRMPRHLSLNQRVTFGVEISSSGRKRAVNVALADAHSQQRPRWRQSPARRDLAAIGALTCCLWLVSALGQTLSEWLRS